jgi:hypothetical protein
VYAPLHQRRPSTAVSHTGKPLVVAHTGTQTEAPAFVANNPIPGRYIAILKSDGNVEDAATDIINGAGMSAKGQVKYKYTSVIKGVAFALPEQASEQATQEVLARIRSRADVQSVVPDYAVSMLGTAGTHGACTGPGG